MESFNLNIIPGKDRPVCHASQYDIGRTIRVNLFEGFNVFTLDGTEVISISVRKPDGNVVTESVTNTSDSYVEFVTTEQMTACHGSNLCELKIEKGADVIGTMNFILEVEQDPLEGGVQSASEIDNLQTQVAGMVATEVADQYDSANVIFDAAPTPGHGNGYAVTSEGVAMELALKQDITDNSLTTTDHTIVGAINELDADKQDATDANLQTSDQTIVGAINELNGAIDPNALRTSLTLGNFAVWSAERILNNSSKDIPLTQNLFVLFIKSYADYRTFGVYLVSYHGSVATSNYISKVAEGTALLPTLSIVDGNKLRIATNGVDVYYSMLRLN